MYSRPTTVNSHSAIRIHWRNVGLFVTSSWSVAFTILVLTHVRLPAPAWMIAGYLLEVPLQLAEMTVIQITRHFRSSRSLTKSAAKIERQA